MARPDRASGRRPRVRSSPCVSVRSQGWPFANRISTIPAGRLPRFDSRTCVRSGPGAVEATPDRSPGRLLGLAPKTLARYRCTGPGPVFCRFGNRVRYRREDLEAWAETRRGASTVDDGTVLPGATP